MGFHMDNSTLVKYEGDDTDVVIPDGVTSIGDRAFSECTRLTSVIIPEGVTSIGIAPFYGCTSRSQFVHAMRQPLFVRFFINTT